MCPRKRRDLLGLAAGTATTALAGCLSEFGGENTSTDDDADDGTDGTDGSDGTTEDDSSTDTADGFDYRSWLPAPDAVGAGAYWTFYVDSSAVAPTGVSTKARERIERVFLPVPSELVRMDEVDEFVNISRRTTVCTYSAPTDEFQDKLTDAIADYTDGSSATVTGTHTEESGGTTSAEVSVPDGYERLGAGGAEIWIADDHFVYGQRPEIMTAMVDAHAGEVERYGETTDFGLAVDGVGDGDIVAGRAESQQFVETATAFAYGWTFGNGTARVTASFAFQSESSVDREQVVALGDQPGFAEYGEFESSTDGRVASISGSMAVDEFDLLQRDDTETETSSQTRPPQVSFEFEFEKGKDAEWDGTEDERIVVTHQGGDSVDFDRLALLYDDEPVRENADVNSTPPAPDEWKAGGEWILRASDSNAFESGIDLMVVWNAPDGEGAAVLATATLP